MQCQNTVPMATNEQQDQEPDLGRAKEHTVRNSATDLLRRKYNFAFSTAFLTFSHYNS